ncbi:MAG: hypothetical protein U1E35_08535 [Rhodospirillales bacterium]
MVNSQSPQVIGGAFLTKVDYTVDGNWAAIALFPLIANRRAANADPERHPDRRRHQRCTAAHLRRPGQRRTAARRHVSDVVTLTLFTNP